MFRSIAAWLLAHCADVARVQAIQDRFISGTRAAACVTELERLAAHKIFGDREVRKFGSSRRQKKPGSGANSATEADAVGSLQT
jgi:hypothetical protein